jgi:hypothetical protein
VGGEILSPGDWRSFLHERRPDEDDDAQEISQGDRRCSKEVEDKICTHEKNQRQGASTGLGQKSSEQYTSDRISDVGRDKARGYFPFC